MAEVSELVMKVAVEGADEAISKQEQLVQAANNTAAASTAAEEAAFRKSVADRKAAWDAIRNAEASREQAAANDAVAESAGRLPMALGLAAAAMAALAAAGAQIMGTFIQTGNELKDLSDKTGMSAGELQKWAYIAQQTGTSVPGLIGAIQMLEMRLGKADEAGGPLTATLERLGIKTSEFTGASVTAGDRLRMLQEGFAGVHDPAERAAMMSQLFGLRWRELGAVLGLSREEMDKLSSEVDKLGVRMSDRAVAAADRFSDSLYALGVGIRGTFYPALESLLVPLSHFVEWAKDAAAESGILEGASGALAAAADFLGVALKGAATAVVILGTALEATGKTIGGTVFAFQQLVTKGPGAMKEAFVQMGKDLDEVAGRMDRTLRRMWGADAGDAPKEAAKGVEQYGESLERVRALIQKSTGTNRDYQVTLRDIQALRSQSAEALARLGLSEEKLNDAARKLAESQPGATEAVREYNRALREKERAADAAARALKRKQEAEAKAAERDAAKLERDAARQMEDWNRQIERNTVELWRGSEAIDKQADALRRHLEEMGLTGAALEELKLKRMEEARATAMQHYEAMYLENASQRELEAILARIAAYDRLIATQQLVIDKSRDLAGDKALEELNKKLARTKTAGEEVGDVFENAAMRATRTWTSFKDFFIGLINDLGQLALKKTLSAIFDGPGGKGSGGGLGGLFNIIGSAIGGALGGGGAAPAAGWVSGFDLPGMAGGGTIAPGGAAIVGEEGPEIALGGTYGKRIVPMDKVASARQGSLIVAPNIYIDSRTDRSRIVRDVNAAMRQTEARILESRNRAGAFA